MRLNYLLILIFMFLCNISDLVSSPKRPFTLLVDCPGPVTLTEGEKYDTSVTGAPKITSNNGGPVTISWLEIFQKGDCRNHADQVTRIFTITNSIGEQVRCNQNITLRHLTTNDIYVPSDTTIDYPDSLNSFTLKLLAIPKVLGSIKLNYFDTRISQNCNIPVRIRRQWTFEDICTGLIRSATTFINVHKYFNHFKHINHQSEAICVDDGFINLTPVGEFAPYTYKWSSGDSLPTIYNKLPGNYTLTLTDRFGCSATQFYYLASMSERADIGGRIITDNGIRVVPDSIIFENNLQVSKVCISEQSGIHYGFTLKMRKPGQYNYRFVKNSEPREGLSTKDIVLIQRHILGISKFNDTLQYIAADVNYNFNITASDISEIRRLILGVKNTFSVVKPWYFLRKDWRTVAKPNRPIADIEFKGVFVPNFPLTNVDVFALKMGDVDISYNGLKRNEAISRSSSADVKLTWQQPIPTNAQNWIPIFLTSNQSMNGIQFQLINLSQQEFKIKNSQLDESFIHMTENKLTISWSTGKELMWNQDLPLFYVNISNLKDLTIDKRFSAEWYDNNMNENALHISAASSSTAAGNACLFYPNPSTNSIHFNFLFEKLHVKICQPEGKMMLDKTIFNNERLSVQHIPTGVYVVSLTNVDGSTSSDLLQIK